MCHHMMPLSIEELIEKLLRMGKASAALVYDKSGRYARLLEDSINLDGPEEGSFAARKNRFDAWPGSRVALLIPAEEGTFDVAVNTWGFDPPQGIQANKSKRIFNTRIETALEQLKNGKGFWFDACSRGRCLVAVRAFFEPDAQNRGSDAMFLPVSGGIMLLAGIALNGHFSVMTTTPNAVVGAYHNRMPLVLAPGESQRWLDGDIASLADRSEVALEVQL